MDIIFIKGLTCDTTLGVYDWERTQLRPVLLDLEIATTRSEAFLHDDGGHGLMNYDTISRRLRSELAGLHYKTVERLAEHIAQLIRDEFHAPWVRVRLGKPAAVAHAELVGVVIERGSRPT